MSWQGDLLPSWQWQMPRRHSWHLAHNTSVFPPLLPLFGVVLLWRRRAINLSVFRRAAGSSSRPWKPEEKHSLLARCRRIPRAHRALQKSGEPDHSHPWGRKRVLSRRKPCLRCVPCSTLIWSLPPALGGRTALSG